MISRHEQHYAGAKTITESDSQSSTGIANPFFALDDVGCNGTESNLLHCLPQHNCGMNRGAENAGVLCLRKGEHNISFLNWPIIIKSTSFIK